MRYLKQLGFFICLSAYCTLSAQEAKKAMTFEEMVSWKRITEQSISHDGKWVACKMEPWRGDASILVYNAKGEMTASFRPAGHAEFSASSRYLLVTKKPELEKVEALKLKKAKEEEMPADELIIFNLPDKKETIDSLKSYKLSETADWIAYKRNSKSDTVLHVRSLDGLKETIMVDVKEFGFAKKGNILYYTTDSTLSTFTPDKGRSLIFEGKGVIKKVSFDETGNKIAFLHSPDKDSTATQCTLYLSENNAPARQIADREQSFILPAGCQQKMATFVSRRMHNVFSSVQPRLPQQKDTTVLADNRPDVQIWKWDEAVQYTQQVFNKEKDLKKSYAAVYNIPENKLIQLADKEIPTLQTAAEGNASIALLSTNLPYATEQMWEGRSRYDIYTVNLETGDRQQIKKRPIPICFSPRKVLMLTGIVHKTAPGIHVL